MYNNIFPSGRLLKVVEKEGTSRKTSKTSSGKTFLFLQCNLYELWRLRLFSFGGYGLALAALALVVFGAIECPPEKRDQKHVGLHLHQNVNYIDNANYL